MGAAVLECQARAIEKVAGRGADKDLAGRGERGNARGLPWTSVTPAREAREREAEASGAGPDRFGSSNWLTLGERGKLDGFRRSPRSRTANLMSEIDQGAGLYSSDLQRRRPLVGQSPK